MKIEINNNRTKVGSEDAVIVTISFSLTELKENNNQYEREHLARQAGIDLTERLRKHWEV